MLDLTFGPSSRSNDGSLALVSCLSGGYKFASVLRCVGLVLFMEHDLQETITFSYTYKTCFTILSFFIIFLQNLFYRRKLLHCFARKVFSQDKVT